MLNDSSWCYYTSFLNTAYNTSGFHISISFFTDVCRGRRPRRPVRTSSVNAGRAVVGASPYNNFTNYAVSICKLTEIIPQDLLFTFAVI